MTCPSFCSTPGCDLPYGRHMSFGISSAALPTRGGASVAERTVAEKQLSRDLDAYKALRRDGLQPPQIDGADRLTVEARCEEHVTMGTKANKVFDPKTGEKRLIKEAAFRAFHDTAGIKPTDAVKPASAA